MVKCLKQAVAQLQIQRMQEKLLKLDIPYYVWITHPLSENVIDNFIDMYAKGLTPNPCVEYNRSIGLTI